MSNNDKFQEEVKKRLLTIEKIAKEIFEQIELLKLLLKETPTSAPKASETISAEPSRNIREETPPDCLHYFGYLRLLSGNVSIPDECLTCQKVIECLKHSE